MSLKPLPLYQIPTQAEEGSKTPSSLTSLDRSPENKDQDFFVPGVQLLMQMKKSRYPVFLAYSSIEQSYLVIKIFPYKRSNQIPRGFMRELPLSSISHKNIISIIEARSFLTYQESTPFATIQMELAPFGDFHELVFKGQNPLKTDMKLLRSYVYQLIQGVEYLHSKGYAHLDLKLSNLLLGKSYRLKIADFDHCMQLSETLDMVVGTKNYRAPECKIGEATNLKACDVFSIAIIAFVFQTGCAPFTEEDLLSSTDDGLYRILQTNPEGYWEIYEENYPGGIEFDKNFKKIFQAMTRFEPEKRATLQEFKKCAWMAGPRYSSKEIKEIMSKKVKAKFQVE